MKRIAYYTNEGFYNRDQDGYEIAKVTENERTGVCTDFRAECDDRRCTGES